MEARQFLEERLFIANPWLARAILTFRKEYCEFEGICFIDDTTKQNFEVFYFIEAQMASFEACRNTLTEFRNSTAEVLCIIFSCLKISCINTSVNLQMMHVIQRLQRKAFNRSMKH